MKKKKLKRLFSIALLSVMCITTVIPQSVLAEAEAETEVETEVVTETGTEEETKIGDEAGGETGYTVHAVPADYVTIYLNGETDDITVTPGDTVNIEIEVEDGYELTKISVSGEKSGTEIDLYGFGGNKYSFTMPEENVSVFAEASAIVDDGNGGLEDEDTDEPDEPTTPEILGKQTSYVASSNGIDGYWTFGRTDGVDNVYGFRLNSTSTPVYCLEPKDNTPTAKSYTFTIIKIVPSGQAGYNYYLQMIAKAMYYGFRGGGDMLTFKYGNAYSEGLTHYTAAAAWVNSGYNSTYKYSWYSGLTGTSKTEVANWYNTLKTLPDVAGKLYICKDANGGQTLGYGDFDVIGYVTLKKSSSNTYITENNDCYSLKGAVYGVYSDSSCTTKVGTLTTNSNGSTNTLELSPGTYYVKEITASPGYFLCDGEKDDADEEGIHKVEVMAGKEAIVNCTEVPGDDAISILLQKIDKETGLAIPQGSASFAGAQYTMKYYDVSSVYDIEEEHLKKTWVFETDETGTIKFSPDYLVENLSNELYTNETGSYTLPLGCYTIEETKAPEGYLLDESVYTAHIYLENDEVKFKITDSQTGVEIEAGTATENTNDADTENSGEAIYSVAWPDGGVKSGEQVKRGDLTFNKTNTGNKALTVPFVIISETTGEWHVIMADSNGFVNTSSEWNTHSVNTNGLDNYVIYDPEEEIYSLTEEGESYLKEASSWGIWFDGYGNSCTDDDKIIEGADIDDSLGALPYDTYNVIEVSCEENSGYEMTDFKVTVTRDNYPIERNTVINYEIETEPELISETEPETESKTYIEISAPKTGDSAKIGLWLSLAALSVLIGGISIFFRRRKRTSGAISRK